MQIILTKDVDNLGRAGTIVKVRPGFARNFLIPRGMALVATHGNLALVEHHKRAIAREHARLRAEAEATAGRLTGVSVSVARKAGQDNKLFGSVTAKDIVEALAAQNIVLDRRLLQLDEPLRTTGTFEVRVRLTADIGVDLKVVVVGV
jgi:large subunit ribosomal protein L9